MKKFLFTFLSLAPTLWAWSPLLENQAAVENSYGIFGNPALLPTNQTASWVASFSPSDSSQQIRAGLQMEGIGLGFRWSGGNGTVDQSQWSASFALPSKPSIIQAGMQVKAWRSAAFSGTAWSASPGILFRPLSSLSLGWSSQDIFATKEFHTRHLFDIAVKPVEPLVLGCAWDLPAFSKQGRRDGDLSLHALLRWQGYEVYGTVPLKGDSARWTASIGIPLGSYQSMHAQGNAHGLAAVGIAGHLDRQLSPSIGRSQWVRLVLNKPIVESHNPLFLWNDKNISLLDLRRQFSILSQDPQVQGVLLDMDGYQGNAAASSEIRRGLAILRRQHKGTAAYLTEIRPGILFAASQAERIILQPSARVHLRGLSADVSHYKGLLDRLGIRADLLRHGRYKSAVEPFTQDTMSTEARADLQNLLDGLWSTLRDSIAYSRHQTPAHIDSIATLAPLTAHAADSLGLVDTALYFDDIPTYLKTTAIGTWSWETRDLHQETWGVHPRIAIISMEGDIVDGVGGRSLLSDRSIGSQNFSALVDQLAASPDIAAIVLRINSPGGSAQASDILWNRFQHLRQELKIPMIVSVGNMAASGGYYIACASDYIVAEPTSIVGSIGIFGGKIDASGLYSKLSVTNTTVKTHPSADAESATRGFTPEEIQILQNSMDDSYQRFVGVVAAARHMTPAHVDSLGEGRVFTGVQGQHIGLVDTLGGLDLAIRIAAEHAGIPAQQELSTTVISYGHDWNMEEALHGPQMSWPWQEWLTTLETPQVWALWTSRFDF